MKGKGEKKIKVALVAPSLADFGGQSIQAKRLLDSFAGNETVEMVFLPNNPDAFGRGVKFLRTLTTSLKFWLSLLRTLGKVDVVHIFSSGTTSYLISTLPPLFAARAYGAKTVLHYHTGEAEEHLKNWPRSRKTMRLFDRIVVPSQFLVEIFARFGLSAEAVFNSVQTGEFQFRERRTLRPIFLSNRNFEAHYRVGDVLRAFALIREKIPNARLIVAGAGGEEGELKRLAADLKLQDAEFIGRVEPGRMPGIYDAADIYLNASVVDNMPLSLIESFACGLPVVTTDAGGIPFIVEHEGTGLLVKAGDYEALARQALRVLENEDLAQKIIAKARGECVKYSESRARQRWLEIYGELAAAGRD